MDDFERIDLGFSLTMVSGHIIPLSVFTWGVWGGIAAGVDGHKSVEKSDNNVEKDLYPTCR